MICKENQVWGMDFRYFITLRDFVSKGDRAVVYVHGGKFVSIIEFIDKYFYSEEDLGWTKGKSKYLYPYRIKFKILFESKN
ncbi:MAG: hypothetical protein ABIK33_04870, partial [candidate division WOR-3 bacterium]